MFYVTASLAQGVTSRELSDYWQQPQIVDRSFSGRIIWDMLQKAAPDECYHGLGNEFNSYDPAGFDTDTCFDAGGMPKVNEGYAWSMTKTGSTIWLGTAANPHCLVIGGMTLRSFGVTFPHETSSWVCEYEQSNIFDTGRPVGDWRPPRIYAYDIETQSFEEKKPNNFPDLRMLRLTTGLRSAGSMSDVVFFAGPSLGESAINMFAFNADGTYIDAIKMTDYENIRKWLVAGGNLYTVAWDSEGSGSTVLKWTGNASDPFQFEIVGHLNSQGRELAFHDNRIFISTRPKEISVQSNEFASLYMSPPVPAGGLPGDPALEWTKVWEITDYEPDLSTASATAGGALASFDGYLYWGTLMAPFTSTISAFQRHFDINDGFTLDADNDGLEEEEIFSTVLGTYRATSVFRGKDFDTPAPVIELLYGQQYFPVYDPDLKAYTFDTTDLHQNNMANPVPRWGMSGFGNFFNVYTWTMSTSNDGLYIGTFDWSYLIGTVINDLAMMINDNIDRNEMPEDRILRSTKAFEDFLELLNYSYGADLLRVPDSDTPGILESIDGLGNFTNYGIRTMVSSCEALYVGTANPMNLLTDTADDFPEGGWELIRIESSNNDIDEDTIPNGCDNCPETANPGQEDEDEDDTGDICDTCTDTDADGFGNPGFPANTCETDNCPVEANSDQSDLDADGIGDACDDCTDTDNDGYGNPDFPINTCETDNCPDLYNPDQNYPDGDTNEDCVINKDDLDWLLAHMNMPAGQYTACDLNRDGLITVRDILFLAKVNPIILRDVRIRALLSRSGRR